MAARLLQPKFGRKSAQLPYIRRLFTTKSESIVYSEHGDPEKVLRWGVRKRKKKIVSLTLRSLDMKLSVFLWNRLQKAETGKFGPSSVSLRMLAAPINPADINQIQGCQLFYDEFQEMRSSIKYPDLPYRRDFFYDLPHPSGNSN